MCAKSPPFGIIWRGQEIAEEPTLAAAVRFVTLAQMIRADPAPMIRCPSGDVLPVRCAEDLLLNKEKRHE